MLSCGKDGNLTSKPGNEGVYWGFFQEGIQTNPAAIKSVEKKVGKKAAMIMWYVGWEKDFPLAACESLSTNGYLPHIVWEAWISNDISSISLQDILNGKYDAYIEKFGEMAALFGKPLMVRWGHEMNGNWYPWSGPRNGFSASNYIKTYQHVHDLTIKSGGSNVIWLWSPNAVSTPNCSSNTFASYYPGDSYVDWIAMDGFNFGASQSWSHWTEFDELFDELYQVLQENFPNKPIMIGEMGTSPSGGKKSRWMENFFRVTKKCYKNIRAWTWFNINKETDWRFDSDKEVFNQFKKGVRDKSILMDGAALATYHKRYIPMENIPTSALKKRPVYQAKRGEEKISKYSPIWGKLEWLTVDKYKELREAGVYLKGPNDIVGKSKIAWNDDELVLFIHVIDDFPFMNSKEDDEIWNGDCIEICLGLNPAAPLNRYSFTNGDYQIGLAYFADEPYVWNWTEDKRTPDIKTELFDKKDESLSMLVRIPWRAFPFKCSPKNGDKLLFNIIYDDSDDASARKTQIVWTGNAEFYHQPKQWGILELGE
jgi:hypothetical protein